MQDFIWARMRGMAVKNILQFGNVLYPYRESNFADSLGDKVKIFQDYCVQASRDERYPDKFVLADNGGLGTMLLAGGAWLARQGLGTVSVVWEWMKLGNNKAETVKSALKYAKEHGQTYRYAYMMALGPISRSCSYISESEFFSILEANGLVDSYAKYNPYAKVDSANGYRGEIGGVAVEVGRIQSFSNIPAQSLFDELILALPVALESQAFPFSRNQLRQVMHELTYAVLVEQSNPFFSLHFSQDGKLYPIIHPVYHNTLVGDVIGMLDYYMKGFLNGGVYNEQFIRNWHTTENTNREYLFQNVIDLKRYAKEHGIRYVSLRELMYRFGLSEAYENNQGNQEYKTNFRTSFRIIAKQGNVQIRDNFLLADPGFDVRYSIDLMPHYQQYVQECIANQGHQPDSYQKLQHVYEIMAREIHDTMPKLPFFKGYFHLLDVISFFCYVLHSLKARGQMPVLSQQFERTAFVFPNSLPPYPVRHYKFFAVKITIGEIINSLDGQVMEQITQLVKKAHIKPGKALWQQLADYIKPAINKLLLQQQLPKNDIEEEFIDKLTNDFVVSVKKLVDRNRFVQEKQLEVLEQLANSKRDLSVLSEKEIDHLCQSTLGSEQESEELNELNQEIIKHFINELKQLYVLMNHDAERREGKISLEIDRYVEIMLVEALKHEIISIIEQNAQLALDKLARDHQDKIHEINNLVAPHGYAYNIPAMLADLQNKVNELSNQITNEKNSQINQTTIDQKISKIKEEMPDYVSQKKQEAMDLYKQDQEKKLAENKKALLENIKKDIAEKQCIDWERLKDIPLIDNKKLPISTLDIADKKFLEAEGPDNKIIGGCGVDLSSVLAIPLSCDYESVHQVMSAMNTTSSETMQVCQLNDRLHYAFKVEITDHLSNEPQHYRERLTPLIPIIGGDEEKSVLSDLLTQAPISQKSGISAKTLDSYGQTILHYTAQIADAKQAKDVFTQAFDNVWDSNGYLPFHTAVVSGNLEVVQHLLRLQPNLANRVTQKHYTPLMLASLHGHTEIVNELLNSGANVNSTILDGSCALQFAIQNNHVATALRLLNTPGINLNQALANGQTPLHEALEINQPEVVAKLIQSGASLISKREYDGLTPFHCAAFCGRDEALGLLLQKAPQLLNQSIDSGETALHLAVKQGQLKIVQWLLEKGADANIGDKQKNLPLFVAIKLRYSAISQLLLPRTNLALKNDLNQSALSIAAQTGDFALADDLLAAGMDFAAHEKSDELPLSYYWIVRGEYQRYKKYLDLGKIDPHHVYQGTSAICVAAHYQQAKLYQLLLNEKPVYKDAHFITFRAEHYAILVDDVRSIKQLVDKNNLTQLVILNKEEKISLVHLAARFGSLRCLTYLLEQLDSQSLDKLNKQQHVLAVAIITGNTDIVDCVLKTMRNANEPLDLQSNTALHYVLQTGDLAMLRHLHSRGLKANLYNKQKLTPWHVALAADDRKALKLLIRLYHESGVPEGIYGYALEQGAQRCLSVLQKVNRQISPQSLIPLFFAAVAKRDFELFSRLLPYGCTSIKNDKGLTLLELAVVNDDPLFFEALSTAMEKLPTLEALLALAIKKQSFQIIRYLWSTQKLTNELAQSCINIHKVTNPWLKLALLGKNNELYDKLADIVNALNEFDTATLKDLLVDFPVNRLWVPQGGDAYVPLLHLAVSLGNESAILLLKKFGVEPLTLDSHGLGLCHKLFRGTTEQINEYLELLNKHFANSLADLINQASHGGLHAIDVIAGFGFKEKLPALFLNNLSGKLVDKKGCNLLHKAARYNNLELLELALKSGVPVDSLDKKGRTPLMIAAEHGHTAFMRKLLAKGADPDQKDRERRSALHYAVRGDSESAMLCLLTVVKQSNQPDRLGYTPLMFAAMKGATKLIPHLLAFRPDFEQRDKRGFTALHCSAQLGKLDAVFLLVAAGHPIDSPQKRFDKDNKNAGFTPLQLAAQSKQRNVIIGLLTLGASITQTDKRGKTFVDYAVQANDRLIDDLLLNYVQLNESSAQANLLLSIARSDNLNLLRKLLLLDHSVDTVDKNGYTPLQMAIIYRKYNMVSSLLRYGANPKVANIFNQQAIHCVAEGGEVAFIRELAKKEYAIDFAAVTNEGETVLHIAARNGHLSCVIELLRLGKAQQLLVILDRKNQTAIHLALANSYWEIAELLLAHLPSKVLTQLVNSESLKQLPSVKQYQFKIERLVSSIKEQELLKQSLLVVATTLHNRNLLQLLYLGNPKSLDHSDDDGNTPLHHAIKQGNLEAVDFLLSKGANTLLKNKQGRTALALAENLKETLICVRLQTSKQIPNPPVKTRLINPVNTGFSFFYEKSDEITFDFSNNLEKPKISYNDENVQSTLSKSRSRVDVSLPKSNLIILASGGERFERVPVLGDGDCGFTAFGITREYAHKLISDNLSSVRDTLIPLIEEMLCTDENFINYLSEDFPAIEKSYRLYCKALENKDKTSDKFEEDLKRYAQDLNLLSCYVNYDIRDKHVDSGWAHPLILFSLAKLQRIPLRLFELNEQGEAIPHRFYPEYHPEEFAEDFTDLLFVNRNHFERLEKVKLTQLIEHSPLTERSKSTSLAMGLSEIGVFSSSVGFEDEDRFLSNSSEFELRSSPENSFLETQSVAFSDLKPDLSKNPNNSAAKNFIDASKSELDFEQWLSRDSVAVLLPIIAQKGNAKVMTFCALDGGIGIAAYSSQVRKAVQDARKSGKSLFVVSKEPVNFASQHYVLTIFHKERIYFIDPTGQVRNGFCNEFIALTGFYDMKDVPLLASSSKLQNDPDGLVSCGVICLALCEFFAEEKNLKKLEMIEDKLETKKSLNEGSDHFLYNEFVLSKIFPSLVPPEAENYRNSMIAYRAKFYALLNEIDENQIEMLRGIDSRLLGNIQQADVSKAKESKRLGY